jgi:zinc protease
VHEESQAGEKHAVEYDTFAKLPAVAIGYRTPPWALTNVVDAAVVGSLLHNGQASLLHQELILKKRQALVIDGGVNWPQGNQWAYADPNLMTSLVVYRANVAPKDVLASYDEVIREMTDGTFSAADLDRVKVQMRSEWYSKMEDPLSRASLLATFVACSGASPDDISKIPEMVSKVSVEEIRTFSKTYLTPANRTIIDRLRGTSQKEEAKK